MCRSIELILALFTPPSGAAYAKPGYPVLAAVKPVSPGLEKTLWVWIP